MTQNQLGGNDDAVGVPIGGILLQRGVRTAVTRSAPAKQRRDEPQRHAQWEHGQRPGPVVRREMLSGTMMPRTTRAGEKYAMDSFETPYSTNL